MDGCRLSLLILLFAFSGIVVVSAFLTFTKWEHYIEPPFNDIRHYT